MTVHPSRQASARYSDRPIIGVGVVVFKDQSVLLIRRGKPPRLGQWSIPGGAQKLGESTVMTAVREVREETGIDIEVIGLLDVIDSIDRDEETGQIRCHYTLVDYVAHWKSGTPCAKSDAIDATWVPLEQAIALPMWDETRRMIQLGQKHLGLPIEEPESP